MFMNKKTVLIIVGVALVLCCIITAVLVFVFKDSILNFISPTITPTPTVSVTTTSTTDVTGQWSGSYIVNSPQGCAGTTGGWNATLLQLNGVLSGTYTSDVGLGGAVSGSISGSDFNWNVGGSGGVTFTGSMQGNIVSGNFTGPICSGNTHTSGTFTGDKL